MTKIETGTWLRDNDRRHPERYLKVLSSNTTHVTCLAVQDVKLGHGALEDDVKVSKTSVSIRRIHPAGVARHYDYNVVTDVPLWAAAMVARRLTDLQRS